MVLRWSEGLFQEARDLGLTIRECSSIHYQIQGGGRLVNVYFRDGWATVHVDGTPKGYTLPTTQAVRDAIMEAIQPQTFALGLTPQAIKDAGRRVWLEGRRACRDCCKQLESFVTSRSVYGTLLECGGTPDVENVGLVCQPCYTARVVRERESVLSREGLWRRRVARDQAFRSWRRWFLRGSAPTVAEVAEAHIGLSLLSLYRACAARELTTVAMQVTRDAAEVAKAGLQMAMYQVQLHAPHIVESENEAG